MAEKIYKKDKFVGILQNAPCLENLNALWHLFLLQCVRLFFANKGLIQFFKRKFEKIIIPGIF